MRQSRKFVVLVLVFLAGVMPGLTGLAQAAAAPKATRPVFSLSPAKIELTLAGGERAEKTITVANHLGYRADFTVSVEDVGGSKNGTAPVVFYENGEGPYSLKNFINLPRQKFTLADGEETTIPLEINLPARLSPGGRYAVVLFSVAGGRAGETKVVSRLGSLVFLRIPGLVREEGQLTALKLIGGNLVWGKRPLLFDLIYENSGNVYLNPYGRLRITNLLGQTVWGEELDPWYVFPGAIRLREVFLTKLLSVGRYTATAIVNRGYADYLDETKVSFWVLPPPLFSAVILALLLFGLGLVVLKLKRWRNQ